MKELNEKLPPKHRKAARCDDEQPDCLHWANTGQCNANPMYMFRYCKKSCNKCTASAADLQKETVALLQACDDYSAKCQKWAREGSCSKYWLYMSLTCRASCKV